MGIFWSKSNTEIDWEYPSRFNEFYMNTLIHPLNDTGIDVYTPFIYNKTVEIEDVT